MNIINEIINTKKKCDITQLYIEELFKIKLNNLQKTIFNNEDRVLEINTRRQQGSSFGIVISAIKDALLNSNTNIIIFVPFENNSRYLNLLTKELINKSDINNMIKHFQKDRIVFNNNSCIDFMTINTRSVSLLCGLRAHKVYIDNIDHIMNSELLLRQSMLLTAETNGQVVFVINEDIVAL